MAHNDFILRSLEKSLGFIGVLGLGCILSWYGQALGDCARYALDLTGRLIAAGCVLINIIQAFC